MVLTWELPRERRTVYYDLVSLAVYFTVPYLVRNRCSRIHLWLLERLVDFMIRLYLKNYRSAELVQLYNALSLARSTVVADIPTNT